MSNTRCWSTAPSTIPARCGSPTISSTRRRSPSPRVSRSKRAQPAKQTYGNIYQTAACYRSSRCATSGAAASARHLKLMYRDSNFERENRIHQSPLNAVLLVTPAEYDVPHSARTTKAPQSFRSKSAQLPVTSGTSLPNLAPRPATRPGTHFSSAASDIDLLLSYGLQDDGPIKAPAPSRMSTASAAYPYCIKSSPLLDTTDDSRRSANSMARQSCDVLGPQSCHECTKICRREENVSKCEENYPLMYLSDENFTAAALVQRNIPGMSDYEIQDKVSRGEIAVGTGFRDRTQKIAQSQTNRAKSAGEVKLTRLVGDIMYSQVFDAKRRDKAEERKLKFMKNMAKRFSNASEQILPTYVSSRKVKKERPRYTASYEAPLLSVVSQNVEPSFFAGSSADYQLPEGIDNE